MLVRPDGATFLTDFRYTERAAPLEAYMEVRQVERDVMKAACAHLAELAPGVRRVGFESAHMTVAQHDRLAAAAPAPPVATIGAVERLREVKDAGEQEAVRRSAALVQPVLKRVAGAGLVGRTERDVAWSIQQAFHELGAEALSFPSIVAAHEHGSQPHAEPGTDLIGPDTLVTIDLRLRARRATARTARARLRPAPSRNGSATRTPSAWRPSSRRWRAYVPALSCSDADGIARDIIDTRRPRGALRPPARTRRRPRDPRGPAPLRRARPQPWRPGMVVTVEPGIYLPGLGGVRIEDLVIVTGDGCERLTGYPKELTTLA